MKKNRFRNLLSAVFLGKRYRQIKDIDEQVRYMTINSIYMVAILPLVILGITMISIDITRTMIDFGIAFMCLLALILIRTNVPMKPIVIFSVTAFGIYCVYLVWGGDINLWAAVWIFAFPPIVIFLCRMTIGLIESFAALVLTAAFLYWPLSPVSIMLGKIHIMRFNEEMQVWDRIPLDNEIKVRVLMAYVLIFAITVIYERISILKGKKEKMLQGELEHEKNIIQIMKDNMPEGIFLMDKELKILPQYSVPLISILSYYEENLTGKSFLDILSNSLETKHLQILKGYFDMIFSKKKTQKVLEAANPLYEFDYKVDNQIKILSAKFSLIEREGQEPVIIGILQDITREKEFEREYMERKEAQEREMKNMFDVIQVDPLVFNDFIDDTDSNFHYINALLKDPNLSERQVVTKFFQNIHAIKSNAAILGLEGFAMKLHDMENDIKKILDKEEIVVEDTLKLAIILEQMMQEKDSYIKIIKKIESFRTTNRLDTILVQSLKKAVEKTAKDTEKSVELRPGHIDLHILESKLRKPIKDILFQCVRNSIYHGIETYEERVEKEKRPKGLLEFSIEEVGGKAEITFSDDGAGLDWEKIKAKYLMQNPDAEDTSHKALLPLIFSPEFSTSGETTMVAGRGVGLSLVKDIVKENGGTIKVYSNEKGTTFKFTFPMTRG